MLAAIEQPAGGAALGEVALATGSAALLTAVLLVLGWGHRSGRIALLGKVAAFAERRSGLPGWVALPLAIAGVSLVIALVGMYWDIALHIDVGRDEGPLANPAHYFILGGLFGIFAAGFLAVVLPFGKPSASAIRLGEDWWTPLGGVLVVAAAAFALVGFPLDDVWHRLFGQDVTLWGPTHLMLIGGASLALLGMAVLLVEGRRAKAAVAAAAARDGDSAAAATGDAGALASTGGPGSSAALAATGGSAATGGPGSTAARAATAALAGAEPRWIFVLRSVALCGGFLLGLATFQAEFDFGVPQFRFVFQPLLIMLAASAGLVAVRIWAGRGAALGAVAFFIAVRGLLALLVGPLIGETTPHFPLYVVAALVVEAIALRATLLRRPFAFALWAGVGIGTVGLAGEWAWTHVWMPLPWPSELLPEALLFGIPTAIAGALIGAWIGERLAMGPREHDRRLSIGAVAGAAVVAGLIGVALYKPAVEGVRAQVTLTDVRGGDSGVAGPREVDATVRLDPPTAADGAEWLTVTAWQGGGFVVDRLRAVGPGRFETTQPIPVDGTWKALLRLQRGNSLSGVPIFLPEDRAIPAPEVAATASFTRPFVADHELLQREQRPAAALLWAIAYAVVLLITVSLLAAMAWGLSRLARAAGEDPAGPVGGGAAATADAEAGAPAATDPPRERQPAGGGLRGPAQPAAGS